MVVIWVQPHEVRHLDVLRVVVFKLLQIHEHAIDVSGGNPAERKKKRTALALEFI